MHLKLGVPNTWYRASIVFPDGDEGAAERGDPRPRQVTGATLPGGPAIVIGSNGVVAWGLTNSGGNWSDLIEIDLDATDPQRYLTPDGSRPLEHDRELIKVKGRADVALDIQSTIWGPVVGRDHRGRPRALRWVALDPEGVNFNLVRMAGVRDVHEAMELATTCG